MKKPKLPPQGAGTLYSRLGRLLVRKGKTCGLFIPLVKDPVEPGIYELRNILGALTLVRIGTQAMSEAQVNARGVGDLVGDPSALMTEEELAGITQDEFHKEVSGARARKGKRK